MNPSYTSIYIPNEIQVTHMKIGKSYEINYDYNGNNYKFIGKVHYGSIMNDGIVWIRFHNIRKYYIDSVLIYETPLVVNYQYTPDPYIPDPNDIRVYKLVYGLDANIMDSIKPSKLYYIKEFPYETTINFKLLSIDINREIRSYIL